MKINGKGEITYSNEEEKAFFKRMEYRQRARRKAADELNNIMNLLDECATRMDKLSQSPYITSEVTAPLCVYARMLSNMSNEFLSATS